MTTEHALASFESGFSHPDFALTTEGTEAYEIACQAMREKIERENPKPLTLDELRNMNGQPVWVENISIPKRSRWAVIEFTDVDNVIGFTDDKYKLVSRYGETWVAYKYKPNDII